jgi:hypothetical protein
MTLLLSNVQIFGENKHIRSITSVTSSVAFQVKKHYNYDFIKNLVIHQTRDPEGDHLETLFENGKLTHENLYHALAKKVEQLATIMKGFKQSEDDEITPLP